MPVSPKLTPKRARAASLARHRGPDHPDTVAARHDLAVAVVEERIRALVAAVPLTDEQRARLIAPLATRQATS